MSKISLVELSHNDREKAMELEKLAKVIWMEHYTPIIGVEQVNYMLSRFQSADSILNDISTNGYRYFLVYDDLKPVGYFAVRPKVFGRSFCSASCICIKTAGDAASQG